MFPGKTDGVIMVSGHARGSPLLRHHEHYGFLASMDARGCFDNTKVSILASTDALRVGCVGNTSVTNSGSSGVYCVGQGISSSNLTQSCAA